ncbi:hypothetical protein PLICRDRAFT_50551 [Plicaturopsis crispa FD-325 SS-3]|nr:hypothetical protein PLICRDRAFT_50551 [Plicaturopsis crispa FD-325 SS-3]
MISALPHDVERIVFEIAAQDDSYTACQLARTARRVQCWVEPIIYERVVLENGGQLSLFMRNVVSDAAKRGSPCSTKPQNFIGKSVKDIRITFMPTKGDDQEGIMAVFGACTAATSFVYWPDPIFGSGWIPFNFIEYPSLFEPVVRGSLRPKRLSSSLYQLTGMHRPKFELPIFAHVTHLEIKDIWEMWQHWPSLAPMSALRYLAFDFLDFDTHDPAKFADMERVMQSCPQLEICLILCPENSQLLHALKWVLYEDHADGYAALGLADPRIVALAGLLYGGRRLLHVPEAEGDMWAQAKELVNARRVALKAWMDSN